MNNDQLQQLAAEKYPATYEVDNVRHDDINYPIKRTAYITGYEDAMKWVSITQYDPLPEGNVLAYNGDEYMIGFLYLHDGKIYCDADMYRLDEVTHYQLLTPPPKQ